MSNSNSGGVLREHLRSREVFANASSAVLGGLLALLGVWWFQQKADARIRIVDLTLVQSPVVEAIDVKLRNTGDRVAFVKHVQLTVVKHWALQPTTVMTAAVPPSAEHTIVLPVMLPRYSVSAPVSHAIAADTVDLFRVNVDSFGATDRTQHNLFLLTVTIIHDESDDSVTSAPILIATGPRLRLEEMYASADSLRRIPSGATVHHFEHGLEANIRNAKEIAALDVPKSPFASAVLNEVLRKQVGGR